IRPRARKIRANRYVVVSASNVPSTSMKATAGCLSNFGQVTARMPQNFRIEWQAQKPVPINLFFGLLPSASTTHPGISPDRPGVGWPGQSASSDGRTSLKLIFIGRGRRRGLPQPTLGLRGGGAARPRGLSSLRIPNPATEEVGQLAGPVGVLGLG